MNLDIEAAIKYVHESNLIEGYDDKEHDRSSLRAWEWLSSQPVLSLTNEIVCELQRMIVAPQKDLQPAWRGAFRKLDVTVGNWLCPDFVEVPRLMSNWLRTYTFSNPKTSHVEFEKIHPFVDGNGRTGRMLMWWLQMHKGEEPTLILNSKKQDYYRWFR